MLVLKPCKYEGLQAPVSTTEELNILHKKNFQRVIQLFLLLEFQQPFNHDSTGHKLKLQGSIVYF